MAWEQLHSGPWHSVLPVWRDAYSMACLHVALLRKDLDSAVAKVSEQTRTCSLAMLLRGARIVGSHLISLSLRSGSQTTAGMIPPASVKVGHTDSTKSKTLWTRLLEGKRVEKTPERRVIIPGKDTTWVWKH
ncbi:unnamed protein product [Sphenostylis stenocarpa]|uniref:DM8 domain-containing protein n=1 Tax=Sphenostylis stenocarpa TaxID=92480 RepID=A0AA86SV17_9FABA|nr:unnamed protein product [Sphenostylis stenocarpa]